MSTTTTKPVDWLSPTNKVLWYKAFKAKADHVVLTDGRKFIIMYETMSSKITGETWEVAHVRGPDVQDGSGYFRMSTVTREEWIYTDDMKGGSDSLYTGYLDSFLKSGENGINVRLEWPELSGRLNDTLRRGFNNAIAGVGRRAGHVKVVVSEGKVYLLKGSKES